MTESPPEGDPEAATTRVSASVSSPTRTHTGIDAYLPTGTILAGRYRIDGIVGVGGMGIVYRAADQQLDVQVAVKVLRTEHASDRRFRERFRRELILARQVSHRNVVRIHDLGEDGELSFLTMDLIEGRSLRDLLEQEGALPLPRVIHLVQQLARALAGAHAQGVIHRDLKPDNVLIDAADNAFVSDFGIARSLSSAALTRTGMVLGTPNYLSPEQARGEQVDGRSDLYTLGIIFFEMLANELPFPGGSDSEVLAQRLVAAPSLAPLDGKVPARVLSILRRLLDRDPARRYQTAPELLDDLDSLAEPSGAQRAAQRRIGGWPPRWAPRAAAVVAGVAVLGLGTAVWGPRLLSRVGSVPPPAVAVAPPPAIAVLPLLDETGRPELGWTARGVAEMLAAELAESPRLRVTDSLRVFRTLEDLGLHGEALAGPRQLSTVGDLLEAERLVTGRVRSVGGGIELDARLSQPRLPGGSVPLHALAKSARELPSAVRTLAEGVRRALAVPAGGASAGAAISPDARAAYGSGLDRLVGGDIAGAAPWLEEATALEPRFTVAWIRLADAYQALGRDADATTALGHAAETLPPGSARLTAEVQARRALLGGDSASAVQLLGALVERYPYDVELLVALAEAQGEASRPGDARASLLRATAIDSRHPRAWYLLGRYAIQSGDSRKAIDDYLVRALVIQNQLENRQGRADVLNAMGVAAEQLGRLDEAEEHYRKAAALRQQIGDPHGWANTLRNLARLSAVRGRTDEAEARLAQARGLLEKAEDRRGLAEVFDDLGMLEEERGRYRQALEQYRQALQTREAAGDKRALADSYNSVGFTYYLLGEYDNASVYTRQALELFTGSDDKRGMVQARLSLAMLDLSQGRWESANRTLAETLEESRSLTLPDSTAATLGYLGRLAFLQGRYATSLDSYRQALAVMRKLDDQRGLVEFTLLEAQTLLALGDRAAAARDLAQADTWLGHEGNPEQRALLLMLRGQLELLEGRAAAAHGSFTEAMAAAGKSDVPVLQLEAKLGAARASLASGDARAASKALAAVGAEARRLGDVPLRLEADAALSRAELSRGRSAEAAAAARDGLASVPAGAPWGGTWRLHSALAAAAARLGQAEAATAARAHALSELERLRRELPAAQRQSFEALTEVRALAAPTATG